jgi:hypothetical protein
VGEGGGGNALTSLRLSEPSTEEAASEPGPEVRDSAGPIKI